MSGKIVEILINKKEESFTVNEAVLHEKKGIFGDVEDLVTLVNKEDLDLSSKNHEFKFNFVISNCDLSTLVNKEFYLGNVLLKGLEYSFKDEKIQKKALVAEILNDGNISLTSQLEIL